MQNIAKVIALTVAMAVASASYAPPAEAGFGKKLKAAVEKKKQKVADKLMHPGATIKKAAEKRTKKVIGKAEKRTKKFVDRRNKQKDRAVGIAKKRGGDAKKAKNFLKGRV